VTFASTTSAVSCGIADCTIQQTASNINAAVIVAYGTNSTNCKIFF
jgi:hypothetical protein